MIIFKIYKYKKNYTFHPVILNIKKLYFYFMRILFKNIKYINCFKYMDKSINLFIMCVFVYIYRYFS